MEYDGSDISPLWVDLERAVLELAVAVDLLSNAIGARTFDNAEGAYALVRASQAKLAGVMAVSRDNHLPFLSEAVITPLAWPISQPGDSGHRR